MTYTSPFGTFELADLAKCGYPAEDDGGTDAPPSPGAAWLRRVEDAAREAWDRCRSEFPDLDATETADHLNGGDTPHEVANNVVPVYTHERWQVFTDLAAWREDLNGHYENGSEEGPDLTDAAGDALYLIAKRLVRALVESWADEATD